MTVTCEIKDYSKEDDEATIKICSVLFDSNMVEIVTDDKTFKVSSKELISAVNRATLDSFGR